MPLRFMSCFTIFITTFMVSCASGTDINYEVANNNRGIDVTSRLYKIEIRDVSKNDKNNFNLKTDKLTYVYGKIKIKNTLKSENKYNLGQYHLSINNETSSGIYVDSVASYITRDEVIRPNETTIKSVYWVFDRALLPKDMGNIKLVILPAPN